MTLTGNRLTPSEGMHLQRKSDGSVAEGVIYIPLSLTTDDFTEITHEEYLQIVQVDSTTPRPTPDPTTEQLNKLTQQTNANSIEITNLSTEITNLQEALCEVYETII